MMQSREKFKGIREDMEIKNLERDRLVFFCNAVIAIAITLLAIDLKIEHLPSGHLSMTFCNPGIASLHLPYRLSTLLLSGRIIMVFIVHK